MQASGWPAAPPSASQRRNMVERNPFTDQQIQDYIDGRLGERDRAAVAAYLLAHPRVAADVEAVRRQSDALRALGHEILDEPVPAHLRRIVHARRALVYCRTEAGSAGNSATGQPRSEFSEDRCRASPVLRRRRGRLVRARRRPARADPRGDAAPRSTAPIRSMARATNRSPFRRSARKSSSRGSAAPSHARCGLRIWTNSATAIAAAGWSRALAATSGSFSSSVPTTLSSQCSSGPAPRRPGSIATI